MQWCHLGSWHAIRVLAMLFHIQGGHLASYYAMWGCGSAILYLGVLLWVLDVPFLISSCYSGSHYAIRWFRSANQGLDCATRGPAVLFRVAAMLFDILGCYRGFQLISPYASRTYPLYIPTGSVLVCWWCAMVQVPGVLPWGGVLVCEILKRPSQAYKSHVGIPR